MSRKLVLSFAALGTLASAALLAGSANAKVANHGHGNGNGGHRPPNYRPHPHFHHHAHDRYIWRYGYRPAGYVAPGFCACLTKEHTLEGVVVFRHLCTKEMASAPVHGAPTQSVQVADPNNFAGKIYQDYLAANPHKALAKSQKNRARSI